MGKLRRCRDSLHQTELEHTLLRSESCLQPRHFTVNVFWAFSLLRVGWSTEGVGFISNEALNVVLYGVCVGDLKGWLAKPSRSPEKELIYSSGCQTGRDIVA